MEVPSGLSSLWPDQVPAAQRSRLAESESPGVGLLSETAQDPGEITRRHEL
jgi:hypothetical protein